MGLGHRGCGGVQTTARCVRCNLLLLGQVAWASCIIAHVNALGRACLPLRRLLLFRRRLSSSLINSNLATARQQRMTLPIRTVLSLQIWSGRAHCAHLRRIWSRRERCRRAPRSNCRRRRCQTRAARLCESSAPRTDSTQDMNQAKRSDQKGKVVNKLKWPFHF